MKKGFFDCLAVVISQGRWIELMLIAGESTILLLERVESTHISRTVVEKRYRPSVAASIVEEEQIHDASELASTGCTLRW